MKNLALVALALVVLAITGLNHISTRVNVDELRAAQNAADAQMKNNIISQNMIAAAARAQASATPSPRPLPVKRNVRTSASCRCNSSCGRDRLTSAFVERNSTMRRFPTQRWKSLKR